MALGVAACLRFSVLIFVFLSPSSVSSQCFYIVWQLMNWRIPCINLWCYCRIIKLHIRRTTFVLRHITDMVLTEACRLTTCQFYLLRRPCPLPAGVRDTICQHRLARWTQGCRAVKKARDRFVPEVNTNTICRSADYDLACIATVTSNQSMRYSPLQLYHGSR